jgi:hypothetical protein
MPPEGAILLTHFNIVDANERVEAKSYQLGECCSQESDYQPLQENYDTPPYAPVEELMKVFVPAHEPKVLASASAGKPGVLHCCTYEQVNRDKVHPTIHNEAYIYSELCAGLPSNLQALLAVTTVHPREGLPQEQNGRFGLFTSMGVGNESPLYI